MCNDKEIASTVSSTLVWLARFLRDYRYSMEPKRLSRAAVSMLAAGISPQTPVLVHIATHVAKFQRQDGGWSDPEETAWSMAALSQLMPDNITVTTKGLKWLATMRHLDGAWGYNPRDFCRIPTTALVCSLVPQVANQPAREWITGEWRRDFRGPAKLSYKGGFFLLSSCDTGSPLDEGLVEETISHLVHDQNDDGGFGPWKNHPIGSEAWSTGVVLWGLSQWAERVDSDIFERALLWLKNSQLPSGVWPYHYLDDGASMAVIGATAAMRQLRAGIR